MTTNNISLLCGISNKIRILLLCRTRRDIIDDGFELNVAMNEIGYRYPDNRSHRLFWSLPSVFTGNKVKSYGGNLTLTQHITAYPGAQSYKDQDILLIGNGITLFWTNPVELQPEIPLVRRIFLIPFITSERNIYIYIYIDEFNV